MADVNLRVEAADFFLHPPAVMVTCDESDAADRSTKRQPVPPPDDAFRGARGRAA